MTPVAVLLGLLVAAYLGSFLMEGRTVRGLGLPSGAEWLAAGFAVGPAALGLVDETLLEEFRPLALVAAGWLAAAIGLRFGWADGARRVPPGRLALGAAMALACGGAVALAVWGALRRLDPQAALLAPPERLLVAAGVGAALSGASSAVVRWICERRGAKGPLTELVADVSSPDAVVAFGAVAAAVAVFPPAGAPFDAAARAGIEIGGGVLLGVAAGLLVAFDPRRGTAWAVLAGVSLLAIGVGARLGLSILGGAFASGAAAQLASPAHSEIRALSDEVERPVLLPALLLVGAGVDPRAHPLLPAVVAAGLGARLAARFLSGAILAAGARAARGTGHLLGLSTSGAGSVSACVGLVFAALYPGPAGGLVLATAAATAVAGEFLAPASLRSALSRAGEIPAAEPEAPAETGA